MEDCGCGGGKKKCITKKMVKKYEKKYPNGIKGNELYEFVKSELKKLDCGCGCKGEKKFCDKYELKGGVLSDCPAGFRQDPLTCLENCPPGARDDGLTCVLPCPEGWITDPLTCRRPITSSTTPCPEGSRDIAGTCWGRVRSDCVDDCFRHPAPGCRTWECGRLRGLFGEDWGAKLCTSCNLRCGQTCWNVDGITKQLHQRNLRVQGGEVIGRQITTKRITGRVDLGATFREMENVFRDVFEGGFLCLTTGDEEQCARSMDRLNQIRDALDPEQNGIADAFRRFGAMTEAAFEDIGRRMEDTFKRFAADTARWATQFAADIERGWGESVSWLTEQVNNPDFWIDFAIVLMNVVAVAVAVAATVGTLGLAGPAAIALVAITAAAGPSIKLIADAARGRPIDGLDVVELALALIPGAGTASTAARGLSQTFRISVAAVNNGRRLATAGRMLVAACRIGQDIGFIPHTYIANVPPDRETPGGNIDAGQDAYVAYAVDNVDCYPKPQDHPDWERTRPLWSPRNVAPERCDGARPREFDWVAAEMAKPLDQRVDVNAYIEEETKAEEETPAVETPAEETPITAPEEIPGLPGEPNILPPGGDAQPSGPPPRRDRNAPPATPPITPPETPATPPETTSEPPALPPGGDSRPSGPPPRRGRGGAKVSVPVFNLADISPPSDVPNLSSAQIDALRNNPAINVGNAEKIGTNTFGNIPFFNDETSFDNTIPRSHRGNPFNAECYARKNPDIVAAVGNDPGRLLTHWREIGSKQNLDADCGPGSTIEERIKELERAAKEKERVDTKRAACIAADYFFIEGENRCDSSRHADGRQNSRWFDCVMRTNSFWDPISHSCNPTRDRVGEYKTSGDLCSSLGGFFTGTACVQARNVDGSWKTRGEVANSLDCYWSENTQSADCNRHKDGRPSTFAGNCSAVNGTFMNQLTPIGPMNFCRFQSTNGTPTAPRFGSFHPREEIRVENFFINGVPINPSDRWTRYQQFINNPDFLLNESQARNRTDIHPPRSGAGMEGPSFTMYYADWCGHCKNMMPEWNKLKSKYKNIEIRKLEEKENNEVQVESFPTIIYHNGSETEKYQGERTAMAFKQFLDSKLSGGKKRKLKSQ